jgi:hypothetical protein
MKSLIHPTQTDFFKRKKYNRGLSLCPRNCNSSREAIDADSLI